MEYSKAEKIAFKKGCRVINGKVISWTGCERSYDLCSGYPRFGMKCGSRTDDTRKHYDVFVHRLVAYQKYGDKIYEEGIEVRHLDGNTLNFSEENIEIGSHSDNMLDIPKKKRKDMARNNIRFSDKTVEAIRNFHRKSHSYRDTMDTFDIPSKSTLWYILNRR